MTISGDLYRMQLPFFQVNAFTQEPFKGNRAGVCLLTSDNGSVSEAWYAPTAKEQNLPVMSIVRPRPEGFDLRWFSPTAELALCGHGTLAAAHVIWEHRSLSRDTPIVFHTLGGVLTVRYGPEGWMEMDFPASFPVPLDLPNVLASTFVRAPRETLCSDNRIIIVLDTEKEVREYLPDFTRLKDHRVIITAPADKGAYEVVSRYFGVPMGVPEDAVTGTAHCVLAPYWCQRLGKLDFIAYQASERGGYLRVRLVKDRVLLSGQAITTLTGLLGSVEKMVY